MDLLDFVRGDLSWRKLLVLLDRLPASSHYKEAVSRDVEYAEQWLELEKQSGERRPPEPPALATWTTEVDMLASIYDRLGELTYTLALVNNAKPSLPKPLRRPPTAVDLLRTQQSIRRREQLANEILEAQIRGRAMYPE